MDIVINEWVLGLVALNFGGLVFVALWVRHRMGDAISQLNDIISKNVHPHHNAIQDYADRIDWLEKWQRREKWSREAARSRESALEAMLKKAEEIPKSIGWLEPLREAGVTECELLGLGKVKLLPKTPQGPARVEGAPKMPDDLELLYGSGRVPEWVQRRNTELNGKEADGES